jgi:O-antigen/teichoic acid export membrane protein
MGLAAMVVIGMNLVLIPRFSAMGAASATVMGECVLLLVTYYCVRRFVRPGRA